MKLTFRQTKYASYLGYVTQAIVVNLAPLLFVVFQDEYHISIEKIGMLISINFGVQILVDFLAAKYVDRIGYRKSVVAAHIFCTVGLLCMGILPSALPSPYLGLCAAVVINAIGGGLIEVLVSPIVEALPGKEKDSAMSMLHSFYCWGHVGVVILSTVYFNVAGMAQWHYLPMLWAIVPLANAVLFGYVPIQTLVEEGEQTPLASLFRVKIFWILFLMMVCSGASEQAMSQWSSYFAERGLQVSKTLGDLLGPCSFALFMGICRLLYGVYGSKMNLHKTIAGGSILCIVSYLLVVFAPHPLLGLLGCGMCGFSVGIMWPGVFSLSAKAYPQGGTAMFAILALAGDLGCSAGPGLVGIVSNSAGELKWGLLFAIVFPILLILSIKLLFFFSRKNDKI